MHKNSKFPQVLTSPAFSSLLWPQMWPSGLSKNGNECIGQAKGGSQGSSLCTCKGEHAHTVSALRLQCLLKTTAFQMKSWLSRDYRRSVTPYWSNQFKSWMREWSWRDQYENKLNTKATRLLLNGSKSLKSLGQTSWTSQVLMPAALNTAAKSAKKCWCRPKK